MSAIVSEPGNTVVIARRRRTDVSWGAITAGWLLSYGVAWLLYLLGSAIGLSTIGFTDENIATGLAWTTVAWIVLTWAASMFLGGLFSGSLTGNPNGSVGSMHGIAVWALATMLGLVLAALTAVNVLQAGQSMIPDASLSQAAGGTEQQGAAGGTVSGPVMTALQAELKQALSEAVARTAQNAPADGATVSQEEVQQAVEQLRPATLATIAAQLARGETQAAADTLVVNTSLSRAEVDRIIQGSSASAQQLQQRAQEAADQAARYSAAALWTLFVSSALGLLLAAWGGWIGSNRVARRLAVGRSGDLRRNDVPDSPPPTNY